MKITEFLINIRRIMKLHELMLKDVRDTYGLSLIESSIISFLHNNPTKDTAGDIVELRMLSKGNVSQAVESLIQKSLLKRYPDPTDRRKIHLSLLPAAQPITDAIDRIQEDFHRELFENFSEENFQLFDKLNIQLIENTKNAIKRRDKK